MDDRVWRKHGTVDEYHHTFSRSVPDMIHTHLFQQPGHYWEMALGCRQMQGGPFVVVVHCGVFNLRRVWGVRVGGQG